MAKLPMGLATLGHVYGHSKFVNVTDGLLLHACILLRKEIHAEKCFKTTSFEELVCKNVPFGVICHMMELVNNRAITKTL